MNDHQHASPSPFPRAGDPEFTELELVADEPPQRLITWIAQRLSILAGVALISYALYAYFAEAAGLIFAGLALLAAGSPGSKS